MFKNYDDILTVNDLMKILKIGRNTAYKLVSDGTIKTIRVGCKYLIPKQFLIDYIYNGDTQLSDMGIDVRIETNLDEPVIDIGKGAC